TETWFEYGTSQSNLTPTSHTPIGSGNSSVAHNRSLSNLNADTLYYYRIVAQNSFGTTPGQIVSFRTNAAITYQCNDGHDKDSDGLIDYPNDPGCSYATDNSEYNAPVVTIYQCNDGHDNDSDGLIDYPNDPGCSYATDNSEYNTLTIVISNESVQYLGNGKARVIWTTNIPATSQVVYGDNPILVQGLSPQYGYDFVTLKSSTLKTKHSMTITNILDNVKYYFRPISDRNDSAKAKGKEVTYTVIKPVCYYLLDYIKLGTKNNTNEVKKLEHFLNTFEGEKLAVNGFYGQADFNAVKRFQQKYDHSILNLWGLINPTGHVYYTTRKTINEMYCQKDFPLTTKQLAEIANFRTFVNSIQHTTNGSMLDTRPAEEHIVFDQGGDTISVATTTEAGISDIVVVDDIATTTETTTSGFSFLASSGLGAGEGEVTTSAPEEKRNIAVAIFSGAWESIVSSWFVLLLFGIIAVLFLVTRRKQNIQDNEEEWETRD
ncbi:hypothetical protein KJ973_01490, partial [Patescibacteria group bacterium]|nr:hypothetical protein [Patescibacteria group bacterium]MBU1519350.1 hypothetical protein [Patescibacteria group bacterium]